MRGYNTQLGPRPGPLLASTASWGAATTPTSLPDQYRHLSHHDVVRWWQRHQCLRLGNDVAHARCRFTANQRYTFTTASAGDCYSRPVRSTVAHWRWSVRDGAGVLVSDAPGRLAADQDVRAGCPH